MTGCEQVLRLVHLDHDGEQLDAKEREAMEAHCASCERCAAARRELSSLRDLLHGALPRPVAPDLAARFAMRLRGEQAREGYWGEMARMADRLVRIAAAFAVAAGLSAAAAVWSGRPVAAPETADTEEIAFVENVIGGDLPLSAELVADVALGGQELEARNGR